MRSIASIRYVLFLCMMLVTAPALKAPAAPRPTTISQMALPNETSSNETFSKDMRVRVRLEMDLRSGRDKVGEVVPFTVDQNVYGSNHTLLLKKGDVARGHVTTSTEPGSVGRSGRLSFTCDYALADDGRRIPLLLSITPNPDNPYSETNDSDGSLDEVSASVSAGTPFGVDTFHSDDPSEYVQSAVPGFYYQQIGTVGRVVFDPVRLFGNGADVRVDRGQQYDAILSAKASFSAPPASQASPVAAP